MSIELLMLETIDKNIENAYICYTDSICGRINSI